MATARRIHFREQLDSLEQQALGAIDIALEQIERVTEALRTQNVELAEFVIADDDRIDGRFLEVHQGILSILALQAPVAQDLRLVAALLHVIKHVERIGDQCVNVAKLIPLSGHQPPVEHEVLEKLMTMAQGAHTELAIARRAFEERDVEMAKGLILRDRAVNRLNREIFQMALECGDDYDRREWAMHMTLVARAFERMGDNAVDIGEQAAFLATGELRALQLDYL
jgi:phosphate transport system protein